MKRLLPALAVNVTLGLVAFLTLTPLLWMVSASLMPPGDANMFPPRLLPRIVTFEHYFALFTRLDLARHLSNSAVIAVISTALSVLMNSMAGYASPSSVSPVAIACFSCSPARDRPSRHAATVRC